MHAYRPIVSGICRDIRIEHAFGNGVYGCQQGMMRNVARVSELRRRPREVEMQRPVADRQKHPDRGAVSLPIAGTKLLRRERPPRARDDGRLDSPFGTDAPRAQALADAPNPVTL